MLPGLILCVMIGCLALQWDTSIHAWEKNAKDSEKVLKAWNEGKPVLGHDEYVQKSKDKFAEKEAEYKQKLTEYDAAVVAGASQLAKPEKTNKPHNLKQADYDRLTTAKAVDGK